MKLISNNSKNTFSKSAPSVFSLFPKFHFNSEKPSRFSEG